MPSFHEFDVALSPNTPAAGASSRTPTNEAHINPWLTGFKGTPVATLSDLAHAPAAVGLTLSPSRTGVVLVNAPTELVLGDLSAPWLLNIADLNMQSATVTLFAGVFIS
jgi:hypothetical protein